MNLFRNRAFHAAIAAGLALAVCSPISARAERFQSSDTAGTSPPPLIPPALKVLAARATLKPGWAPLERYAASASGQETKGLAYLALGYHEYQAADYSAAMDHLARAAAARFTLADFADYYRASSASLADEPEIAAQVLTGFASRYPHSTLRAEATRLLAWSLIGSHRPQDAIGILESVPDVQKQPALELLLGQAREQAGESSGAVEAYQDLYYRSPNAPEAGPAGSALKRLEAQMGGSYPAPSRDLLATRAAELEKGGHYEAALSEYEALLRDDSGSASAAEWRLGRDRCWFHLGRNAEALADLSEAGWPSGEVDAERGLALVRVTERSDDQTAMLAEVDRLSRLYPQSQAYAAALNSVAFFFTRQEDWGRGAVYNGRLAAGFPDSDLAGRALWEAAWAAYLGGERDQAEQHFLAYLGRYPTSFRVPAALYWIGRLEELQGRPAEAQSIYGLLTGRFRNDYYSFQASSRLRALPAAPAGGAVRPVSAPSGPFPPEIETVRSQAVPLPDPALLCERLTGTEERPAMILATLGLGDLAEHDLHLRLQAQGAGAESSTLHLALARVERDDEKFDLATYNAKRAVPAYAEYDFAALPAELWSLLYPQAFWDLVRRDAFGNHLDPYMVMALVRQESGFNPKAVSGPGARGLMQLLPPARDAGRRSGHRRAAGNLLDPGYNLRAGCSYLSQILREFNGSLEQALAAYNAGPDRVKEWMNGHSYAEPAAFVESIPFPETRAYVEAVMRDTEVYRRLMTGKPKFRSCRPQS